MNRQYLRLLSGVLLMIALPACQTPGTSGLEEKLADQGESVPSAWAPLQVDGLQTSSWQNAFSDPKLRTYLGRSSENFDVQIAEARLQQADAARLLARSRLGPSLGLGARGDAASALEDPDFSETFSLNASTSLDLSPFGPNRAGLAIADAGFRSESERARDVKRAVDASIVRAYYGAIEADQLLALAEANLDFQEQTLAIGRARFEAGQDARDTLALAEASTGSAEAELEIQRASRRDAHRALSLLVGDFPKASLDIGQALDVPLRLPERGVPALVLAARPDVQRAEAAMASAEASLWQARRARIPRLALSGSIGGNSPELEDLFDPAAYLASLGTSLATTLFDSGGLKASTDRARSQADEALRLYAQALRQGVGEIESAYDRAAAIDAALQSQTAATRAGREALRLARIRYQEGDTDLIDLLTIQRQVNGFEASLIRTRSDRIDAMVAAFLATGGDMGRHSGMK